MKDRAEGVLNIWEKYKFVALVILAGIILLLLPSKEKASENCTPSAPASGLLEQQLTEALEHIAGVGQAQVMLTLQSDGERQLAENRESSYRGDPQNPEEAQQASEIVLKDGGGGDEPLVLRTIYPTYRGALVICQGADRAEVRLAVTEAVQALTGLQSNHISVAKWQ